MTCSDRSMDGQVGTTCSMICLRVQAKKEIRRHYLWRAHLLSTLINPLSCAVFPDDAAREAAHEERNKTRRHDLWSCRELLCRAAQGREFLP